MNSDLAELFSINVPALIAAFIFGVIGFWMYKEGRRREHTMTWSIGLALMIYPYFVSSTFGTWAIGLGLCGASYYYWHR